MTKPASIAAKKPARTQAVKTSPEARNKRQDILEPIFEALRKRLPKSDHSDAIAFAGSFYWRMSEDEIALHTPESWAALATDFLDFARRRKPGKASIRLFNPSNEAEGWSTAHTVLQIVNDDMPFLVDTVSMALAEQGVGVHVLGHPLIPVRRDRAGKLLTVGEGTAESMMHLEIDRQSGEGIALVSAVIGKVLGQVRAIVNDWTQMREQMLQLAADLATHELPISDGARREAQEFLRWAGNDHFVLFGYRQYKVVGRKGEKVLEEVDDSGLGLLRGPGSGRARPLKELASEEMKRSGLHEVLILTKTNSRSVVHRPGYMDYVGVLTYDSKGEPTGEHRFIGLYSASAYKRRPWEIPLVRERFEHVMSESGLRQTGHSGQALKHILETLPRDELFQSTPDELLRLSTGVLSLQERVRSRLFLRCDRYSRFYSILAYIPRDRFNTDVRLRIEAMLKDVLKADRIDTSVLLGESPLAQLHLIVRSRSDAKVDFDQQKLDDTLASIVRNWYDDLREVLVGRSGEAEGLLLANTYGRALSAQYIEQATPEIAADDVIQLHELRAQDELRLRLYCLPQNTAGERPLRLKIFSHRGDITLSQVLPLMENMGLRVLTEHPYRIHVEGQFLSIQDFEVETLDEHVDVVRSGADFEDAFSRIWSGLAENDGFNRLVLGAGLNWRQVAMLRAYAKFLLQAGVSFSQAYMEQTLNAYPLLTRLLVELFEVRFDPGVGVPVRKGGRKQELSESFEVLAAGNEAGLTAVRTLAESVAASREERYQATRAAFDAVVDQVVSLDQDRILHGFVGVVDATLRTSYYQPDRDGNERDHVAYKFDSNRINELPRPRPYREIFVCGPEVEGVHLRFGPVARGGLRWSDRREDFRTEVLGLVKAQMVKNTVIVPVGAKGGFFVKRPPASGERDAVLAQGIACYKRFINSLLDITDNIVDGKVVPPRDVVRHDDDDAYLVVAADKGTATFSDIANGISADHGFWMGDAFASGGSVGYDHKGMGITAKGAWESVKRHFRSLGHDSQTHDFTAVGIGDMSGDVFGNGMLLSRHIRLVAAFDHRHIFIDPDPDSATSFVERERMFALPRSSWADYGTALISKGGGVWPRSAKSIALSAQAKAALGIDEGVSTLSPSELINAILKAPVDLLWNGGIGTYVKSSQETHADVGDRTNDAIRINGNELRCKVVGEGGNLGLTQRGRIEAAMSNDVLLNTDFIDNSAGVDTSDHEVNIKILLNTQVKAKKLGYAARNKLLAEMTDQVEALVLWDNTRQNQAISLMQRMSVSRLGAKQHFIRTLEAAGDLDRQIEFLPSDAELSARKSRGQGLSRPELSVLLSYAKLVAYQQMLDSDIPEDPYLSKELQRYFPPQLHKKYAAAMESHPLKREIIATAVTNTTINRMGATFLMRMQEDTGRGPAEVAKAYTISRETLDARALWARIDALDGIVSESAQIDALLVIWNLQRAIVRWLLNRPGEVPPITAAVERYKDSFNHIRHARDILPASQRTGYVALGQQWRDKGFPADLAEDLAELPYLSSVFDIIELSLSHSWPTLEVAKTYFRLGEALHLPWLQQQIDTLEVQGYWHAVARGVLRDDLATQHSLLTGQVLGTSGKTADEKVANWLQRDDKVLRFTVGMLEDMFAQTSLDYPTSSVAVSRLAQLAATAG